MFMSRNFEKEFQKRTASEFDVNVVISSYGVEENRHATKGCNLLAEKRKDFSYKSVLIRSQEKSLSGDGWCHT